MIYIDNISTHSYGTSLISEKKVNFKGQLHPLGMEQTVKLVDLRSILSRVPNIKKAKQLLSYEPIYDLKHSIGQISDMTI